MTPQRAAVGVALPHPVGRAVPVHAPTAAQAGPLVVLAHRVAAHQAGTDLTRGPRCDPGENLCEGEGHAATVRRQPKAGVTSSLPAHETAVTGWRRLAPFTFR